MLTGAAGFSLPSPIIPSLLALCALSVIAARSGGQRFHLERPAVGSFEQEFLLQILRWSSCWRGTQEAYSQGVPVEADPRRAAVAHRIHTHGTMTHGRWCAHAVGLAALVSDDALGLVDDISTDCLDQLLHQVWCRLARASCSLSCA